MPRVSRKVDAQAGRRYEINNHDQIFKFVGDRDRCFVVARESSLRWSKMGKVAKRARARHATLNKMVKIEDPRIRWKQGEKEHKMKHVHFNTKKKPHDENELVQARPKASHMFFKYNTALGPPFHILMDTNFINFSIQNKIDVMQACMDTLYGKCIPCVTDCVMAEFEKLGFKYRLALRLAKDPRFERLPCTHKGTYADDCIVNRVKMNSCYIVGTCDKDLKRRLRKVPGVPIMSIKQRKYSVERMPDALGGIKA